MRLGMVGLGRMGANMTRRLMRGGHEVVVTDLSAENVKKIATEGAIASTSLDDFVAKLGKPGIAWLMVPAGGPTEQTVQALAQRMQTGAILIDGGNSYFKDDVRRAKELKTKGMHYVDVGTSGGVWGLERGYCMMIGGPKDVVQQLDPIFKTLAPGRGDIPRTPGREKMTGTAEEGYMYCGPSGAGHFVKMVHNGIEYADMQLIAEAYEVLHQALGATPQQLADIFGEWDRGPLESYLIAITAEIFSALDPVTGRPLIQLVLDKAGQKGTGRWTAQVALDLGVPVPTIAAAIDARALSAMKEERVIAARVVRSSAAAAYSGDRRELIRAVHDALYASKICAYAQGMSLIRAGSAEWKWDINLREMARIWKGGCIIRARFLDSIMRAFERQPELPNLLLDAEFLGAVQHAEPAWRKLVALAAQSGIPAPAISSSLSYFDAYRSAQLPQNLTQAQRDYFGAHGYQRTDRPGSTIRSDWRQLAAKAPATAGAKSS
ncbi:MAG TPA: NADP-dependent phosphogluconate dehydrogenase [Terriglobales bacterium]|nr:NADP-dependent phosphogluconate dehydrogenase [Terriglobales bacterium]